MAESHLYRDLSIFTGNAHPALANAICSSLEMPLGQCEVFEFSNENIFVRVLENVRSKDVFIVQPLSSPVSRSVMELLIMIDAFKRASAGRITAVLPVLRLRPQRQEGPAARADHGAPPRQPHRDRRR